MADLPLGFQLEGGLVGPAGLEVGEAGLVLGVHQVKVEVIHSTGLQLAFEEGPDVRLGFEEAVGELVRQDVLLPGVTAGEGHLQGRLALALDVAVGSIEVVEAPVQKGVYHALGLLYVYLFPIHRQTHTAEAEVLFDSVHCVRSLFVRNVHFCFLF